MLTASHGLAVQECRSGASACGLSGLTEGLTDLSKVPIREDGRNLFLLYFVRMISMNKKILLAGLLSACIAGTAGAVEASAAKDIVYGDANCDGSVGMSDAVLIMQSMSNPGMYGIDGTAEVHLTDEGADRGDVYERGGGLTPMDALTIQRYLLKLCDLPESYAPGYVEPAEEETEPAYIHLKNNTITTEGKNVSVSGKTVTITHSGTFFIDGTLNDGQICVAVPDEKSDPGTVKLIFDNVSITGVSGPAILVKNADKTSITLADGTENSISDGSTLYSGDYLEYALVEAKDDLTIKAGDEGTGVLTITANVQPAVVCNNDIKITGGTVNINTLDKENGNDAVKGKKSVTVKGGTINIDSEGDGLKSSKGSLDISGGNVRIKSGKDALQAETTLTVSGGDILACGDRGLRCEGAIDITGGTLLATATDYQCGNLTSTQQNTIMLDYVKEWSKNNPVAMTDQSGRTIFELDTLKKFRYAVVSSPDIVSGTEYRLYTGGIETVHEQGQTYRAGTPAVYKDVNNTDDADLLYGDLFDRTEVHSIDVKMSDSAWTEFMSHANEEVYYPCDVVIDGEEYKNVGIRTKGNSSRMFVYQAGHTKYSFRIKLDKYDKYQNYHGLTEICMNNMYSDPSCMRDILCYDAMYDLDAYAPEVTYTNMSVNGKLYSFYLLCEQPGTTLAERLATNDDAVFYKAADVGNQYDCTFSTTMSMDNFEVKFGDDEEKKHIKEVVDAINKVTPQNYKFIEDIIDVPSFMKGFAVNAVMCNYDSYNGMMPHNYYVLWNEGKMYYVGWDYNLSLGNFMDYGASVNSDINTGMYQADENKRPMLKNLLSVPEYKTMYIGYVKDIVKKYSDPEKDINKYAGLIRSHVKADPRSFFTADQFESNIAKSPGGLQVSNNSNPWGGMWGGGFGFGFGFGQQGGLYSYGGDQVSILDFMIKRNEVIKAAIGG